jgi:hypothetical protein
MLTELVGFEDVEIGTEEAEGDREGVEGIAGEGELGGAFVEGFDDAGGPVSDRLGRSVDVDDGP